MRIKPYLKEYIKKDLSYNYALHSIKKKHRKSYIKAVSNLLNYNLYSLDRCFEDIIQYLLYKIIKLIYIVSNITITR
jgi:hypothetical protein